MEVVMLRGICEAHAERSVLPALRELQAAQGLLLRQVAALESRLAELGETRSTPAAAAPPQPDAAIAAAAVEEDRRQARDETAMRESLALKADTAAVPTLVQFEELLARVFALEEGQARSAAQPAEPTHRDGQEEELRTVVQRLDEVAAAVKRKPNLKDVASVDRLDALIGLLDAKADSHDVPSRADLQKLSADLNRKAATNKVPTIQQFNELRATVELKVDARLVPTTAQVDELAAEVRRKNISTLAMEEIKKVMTELSRKANSAEVPSTADVEQLVAKMLQPQVEGILSKKAETSEVPSLKQHKEFAAATERKLSFLANKVQQKNDGNSQWDGNTVWCIQPAMVDVNWDQTGQAWTEWNPSRAEPNAGGSGFGGNGYPVPTDGYPAGAAGALVLGSLTEGLNSSPQSGGGGGRKGRKGRGGAGAGSGAGEREQRDQQAHQAQQAAAPAQQDDAQDQSPAAASAETTTSTAASSPEATPPKQQKSDKQSHQPAAVFEQAADALEQDPVASA